MDKLATKKALANIAKALNSKVGDSNARIDEIISNMDFMTGRDIINILESIGGELPYGFQYFTVEALGNGNITFNVSEMEYSTDGGTTWNTWDNGGGSGLAVTTGDKVMFNSTKEGRNISSSSNGLNSDCNIKVYGNINTIIFGDHFLEDQTQYGTGWFLKNNTHLVDAENLILNNPLKDDAPYCWQLFMGCTALTKAPKVPGKYTVAENSFYQMFKGCTSLVNAPEIEMEDCYSHESCMSGMFEDCTALVNGPDLSKIRRIGSSAFQYMFRNCTALVKAPKLNLNVNDCRKSYTCNSMFTGCTSLSNVSEFVLGGGTRGPWEYNEMFKNCTSLTHVPQCQGGALEDSNTSQPVFDGMFYGCTALLDVIPGEYKCLYSGISGHFGGMYRGCSSITDASSIIIRTITKSAFSGMFRECTSLTKSPDIDLTDKVQELAPQGKWDSYYIGSAFYGMFSGCTSLNYVKCIIPGYPNANSNMSAGMFGYAGDSSAWLYGVSATGTFVRGNNATWWPTAANGIPSGWTVQNS